MAGSAREERGASALELSILAPVFLLLVFLLIEFGLWMHGKNAALAAAREGVAELRTTQSFEGPEFVVHNVENGALNSAHGLGMLQDPQAHAEYNQVEGTVTVTVTGTVLDLVPGIPLTAEGTATGYIENWQPDLGPDGEGVPAP